MLIGSMIRRGIMRLSCAVGCATLAFVGFSLAVRSEQIGPSFDCHVAQQPLAQMLCADPKLSLADLRFAQAYFALLKQVGDAGKRELKEEDLRFLQAVQQQCGIAASGQPPSQSEASLRCVKSAYEAERAVWVSRLTPPFSEEARRPIEQHVALQRLLQQLAFLPADAIIDGVYGAATREAISKWQNSQSRNVTGVLSDSDARELEQQARTKLAGATAPAKPPSGSPDYNQKKRPTSTNDTGSTVKPLPAQDGSSGCKILAEPPVTQPATLSPIEM
jgi:uncharacterized protein YecT (DUF1311 family)